MYGKQSVIQTCLTCENQWGLLMHVKQAYFIFDLPYLMCSLYACQSFHAKDFQWRDKNLSDFIKYIFIRISKMNESLMGLEQHDGE